MRSIVRILGSGFLAVLSILALSACGGGSSSAPVSVAAPPTVTPPQQPAEITGIATPSSISVVTATNAN